MSYFDVIIVGAGLSGIGAAHHLQKQCPDKTFHILEGRDAIGGTWDLFRYPGIRSDSDMFTLGYSFKPWLGGKVLADGPSIKAYVEETAVENGIVDHISFRHRVSSAAWSSEKSRWTVKVQKGSDEAGSENSSVEFECGVLLMCAGYYSYKQAYTPEFDGMSDFDGQLMHAQFWPENLDYKGKQVVVVGSGATAVTIVPAIADAVEKVTMLQRTPTYMASRSQYDQLAALVSKVLPAKQAYSFARWKNAALQRLTYVATRVAPGLVKKVFIGQVKKQLGPDYDVDTHFTPPYNPWDQRLCAVPDNDFFEAINKGKAEVVTDEIASFTKDGIRLKSGGKLSADIVVLATGLNLLQNGGTELSIDGEPLDISSSWSYKGMMYSGVPNLITTFGYINASWTLRADMVADFMCRLLNEMDSSNTASVTPVLRDSDKDMPAKLWIEDFSAGYMAREMHLFPKQGDREPWLNTQNYNYEKKTIAKASLRDGVLSFS